MIESQHSFAGRHVTVTLCMVHNLFALIACNVMLVCNLKSIKELFIYQINFDTY